MPFLWFVPSSPPLPPFSAEPALALICASNLSFFPKKEPTLCSQLAARKDDEMALLPLIAAAAVASFLLSFTSALCPGHTHEVVFSWASGTSSAIDYVWPNETFRRAYEGINAVPIGIKVQNPNKEAPSGPWCAVLFFLLMEGVRRKRILDRAPLEARRLPGEPGQDDAARQRLHSVPFVPCARVEQHFLTCIFACPK